MPQCEHQHKSIGKDHFFLFSLCRYVQDDMLPLCHFIIHQTHYEKSDWSRAFNQFTIACELDMIHAISAADIAFIMSSSTSAWLLSPLECSPQKQNGWTLRFCFWVWIMWKMYNGSWKFGRTRKSCGNTRLRLVSPQHLSFSQTFTRVSI